jgi:hypothetical protein
MKTIEPAECGRKTYFNAKNPNLPGIIRIFP